MSAYPEETDFISLFCTEPQKLDEELSFFYNQSTFLQPFCLKTAMKPSK
ncbi:hypothetical protein [Alkalihalobacillus trypoxylicola]|nr:hypothetical protein [Alkalihalobacillus trypoxylicola]